MKGKDERQAEEEEEDNEEEVEEALINKRKINVWDIGAVKGTLDEQLFNIALHEYGTKEITSLRVMQVLIGLFSVILAVGTYFIPLPRERQTPFGHLWGSIAIACCLLFFLLVVSLHLIGSYVERKTILLSSCSFFSAGGRGNSSSKSKDADAPMLRIESWITDAEGNKKKRKKKQRKLANSAQSSSSNVDLSQSSSSASTSSSSSSSSPETGVDPADKLAPRYKIRLSLVKKGPLASTWWLNIMRRYRKSSVLTRLTKTSPITHFFDSEGTLHFTNASKFVCSAFEELKQKDKSA